jgi:hypothetical protein
VAHVISSGDKPLHLLSFVVAHLFSVEVVTSIPEARKPPAPENRRGTSTLSEYHCAHTWNLSTAFEDSVLGLLISISSCSSAVKYSCMVAIMPNTQSALSDSKTKCL